MEYWSDGVLGETAHLTPMLRQLGFHHSSTPLLHHSITPPLHHSSTPPLHCSTTPPIHHSTNPSLFMLHKIDIDRIRRIIYRLMLANFGIWAGLLNNRFDNPIWTA